MGGGNGGQREMESESNRGCSRPAGDHPVCSCSLSRWERRLHGFALRDGWMSRCWGCAWVWRWRTLVHGRERWDDVLTIQHWVGATRMEWHALSEAFYLVSQHFNLPRHVCVRLLHMCDEINSFAEDLPFASLHAPILRELVPQLVKQILHLLPSFPFCQFMRDPELWRARVRCRLPVL